MMVDHSLEQAFSDVYTKFKLQFYLKIFKRFEGREATLTAVETFCVEVIHALGQPTVSQFADFVNITPANATAKVKRLVEKGYLRKVQSQEDRREFFLVVTERFYEYLEYNTSYMDTVIERIEAHFDTSDVDTFKRMLTIISRELMSEVELLRPEPRFDQ
ncbi:MAG: MarR family transcriptional regulator [Coriobacteriales bacterium]|jgi:DNA-binding MarR family transcriptional regulator|nr:MarR family transcriptional regulator [Coriobacteriales bacterium]